MTSPMWLKVIFGEQNSQKVILHYAIPTSVSDLSKEIEKQYLCRVLKESQQSHWCLHTWRRWINILLSLYGSMQSEEESMDKELKTRWFPQHGLTTLIRRRSFCVYLNEDPTSLIKEYLDTDAPSTQKAIQKMVMGVLVVKIYSSDIEDSPADVGVVLKGVRVLGPQHHCVCDNHAYGTDICTELELPS